MNDTKSTGDKTLHVDVKKTLTLKPKADTNVVRQSFSHGRSKAVLVETKKKRPILKPGETEPRPEPRLDLRPETARPDTSRVDAVRLDALRAETARQEAARAEAAKQDAARAEAAREEAVRAEAERAAAAAAAPVAPPVEVAPPRAEAVEPVSAPVEAPKPAPAPVVRAAAPAARPAPTVTVRPAPAPQPAAARGAPAPAGRAPAATPQRPQQGNRTGVVLQTLSADEQAARGRALIEARAREIEDRKRAEEDAKRRAEEDARLRREREDAARRLAEEEARKRADDEARRRAEAEAQRRLDGGEARPGELTGRGPVPPGGPRPAPGAVPPKPLSPVTGIKPPLVADDEDGPRRPGAARPAAAAIKRPMAVPPAKPTRAKVEEKPRGKLTVVTAQTEEDEEARGRSVAAFRRRVQRQQRRMQSFEPREKVMREVVIPETITIQELANRMAERGVDVIKLLMKQGQMLKINDVIDADMAQLIAEEMGHTVKRVAESDVEEGLFASTVDDGGDTVPRPPVVTIMGHVDHGKTSLLDAIRSTKVAAGEAGGITQHIGAYQVESHGQKITFIDTPGHEAFTAMRSRGAKATDIVILVVAADDGVMPTTVEAINHTRAAGVPMIVAINKIDKPDANPDRVRNDLLRYEIVVESMGGDVLEVEVSATKKINLDKLLEAILLQSEVLELKANPERSAEGTVIEAKLDKGRGPVATVLVQRGTLKVGDILVAGGAWGKVRALLDDHGEQVKSAGPSMPVEVLGFQDTPEAGDRFAVTENEGRAREIADYRQRLKREKVIARGGAARGSLAEMMSQLKDAGRKEFVLVVKTDVQGSLEAITGALDKLGNDEVRARIIHGGVGGITESDITLASASDAVIIGFNVRASKEARESAEREGIEIRYYNIIYDLVDDVKTAMSGMLPPTLRETMLGNARILEIFNVSKVGKVAGCLVTDGTVERGANVRLIRDNVVIHEGKLSQLKRFKDDAKEVSAGQECGMAFENYQDMRAGDVIECYRVETIARTL
jgi:translation initiation factor IF-2